MKSKTIVELFTYVENCVEDGTFYFKFTVFHQLYEKREWYLGVEKENNRTWFNEKVLAYFPQTQKQSDCKNKILVFEQGTQQKMRQSMASNCESDAILLAKATKVMHKEIVSYKGFHFDGKFPSSCQQGSVTSSLLSRPCWMVWPERPSFHKLAGSLTVSQTILFNLMKHVSSSAMSRNSLEREPPLSLYIGMNTHTETRSKKIITQLYDLGHGYECKQW